MQNHSKLIYLFLNFFWNFNYIMTEKSMLWDKVEVFEDQKYEQQQNVDWKSKENKANSNGFNHKCWKNSQGYTWFIFLIWRQFSSEAMFSLKTSFLEILKQN